MSILFVCRANVCRSPVAEFAATEGLSGTGLSVSSAGTDAVDGHEICPRASDFLAELAHGRDFASRHRATRMSAAHLSSTALIVTATPRERSVVARLDPDARSRAFTMVELERLLTILPPTTGPTDLPTLVAQLHAIRWQATSQHWVPPTRIDVQRLNPWRALRGLSVQDAHGTRRSIHAPVLHASRRLATSISDHLQIRLSTSAATSAAAASKKPRRDGFRPTHDTRHAG